MREFKKNEDGTWFARETEKPGCMTDGWATMKEAATMLDDAERGWDEAQAEEAEYMRVTGGVPFDHWGKGCPNDCSIPEHVEHKS